MSRFYGSLCSLLIFVDEKKTKIQLKFNFLTITPTKIETFSSRRMRFML